MRTWSEVMASIEVIQSKTYILEGYKKTRPGTVRFILSWNTASVEFHPEKGKKRYICIVNFDNLHSSTEQSIKNIFFYLERGILKIQNEN
jgi:hypothetical protein